eukprot:scaffold3170_cov128-Cylindrotheca_fusiformis.AAC.13
MYYFKEEIRPTALRFSNFNCVQSFSYLHNFGLSMHSPSDSYRKQLSAPASLVVSGFCLQDHTTEKIIRENQDRQPSPEGERTAKLCFYSEISSTDSVE